MVSAIACFLMYVFAMISIIFIILSNVFDVDVIFFGGLIAFFCDGVFEIVRELGSTKHVIVGHDHVNNWSIRYRDVLLYRLSNGFPNPPNKLHRCVLP